MTESNVPPPPDVNPPPTVPATAPVGYAGPMTSSGYPGPYVGPAPDANAKTMGMLCHIAALAGFIVPLGSVIGPLVL